VTIRIDQGIADVRLNRPEKMNALDLAMFEALVDAAQKLSDMSTVRVVVISGEGRAFCAGIDMLMLSELGNAAHRERIAARSNRDGNVFQRAVLAWCDVPVPVIAAVHGVAFGGGFQLSLGADMRYVEAETKLAVMEIRWGLVPDMAGSVLMRALAREDIVRELCYSGRVFSGRDAMDFGFATRICQDSREEAFNTAREIACKSPDAIRAIKRLLSLRPDTGRSSQLLNESVSQNWLLEGRNHAEAVAAAAAKREPIFEDAMCGS
jgi:enoyl-CoA hydratase/carnithine racemase